MTFYEVSSTRWVLNLKLVNSACGASVVVGGVDGVLPRRCAAIKLQGSGSPMMAWKSAFMSEAAGARRRSGRLYRSERSRT